MCRSSDKKCTKVLSLKDGEVATTAESFLCESGFSLEGKCSMATLKTEGACETSCTYMSNGTEINSTSACVCGKNTNGDKYCNFGSNSTQHNNTINLKMKYLNANNTVVCHTSERFTPCVSQALEALDKNTTTHNSFDFQKEMKNYHNEIIVNNVEFVGQKNGSCILPVVGAYYTDIITPVSQSKCPAYSCDEKYKACASSYNPNNYDSSDIKISFNKNVCLSNQTCSVPDLSKVYLKEKVDSVCLDKTTDKQKFPGESCLINDDCINKDCTDSKVCQHIANEGKCSSAEPLDLTKQCGVGAYCDSTSICKNLIKKDKSCTNTFDCLNNLVCFNKTCSMEYGRIKDGEKIEVDLLSADFGYRHGLLCESMAFDDNTQQCYSYKYANITSMRPNVDGYVQCNKTNGLECAYNTTHGSSFQGSCVCGFNAEGNGYCPIDFSGKYLFFCCNFVSFFFFFFF
jgi:hypothetical protein